MSQISPPIRIVLVAAVAFLAAWMLVLRPKTESVPPPAPAATAPAKQPGNTAQSAAGQAVQAAENAKATAESAANARAGESTAPATSANSAPATANSPQRAAAAAAKELGVDPEALATLPAGVRDAIKARKVVVLGFFNKEALDDRAAKEQLAKVHDFHGRASIHSASIDSVQKYQAITRGVDVSQSPSIIVIGRDMKAQLLTGYVDHVAVEQAIVDTMRRTGVAVVKAPYLRQVNALCGTYLNDITVTFDGVEDSPRSSLRTGARQFDRFSARLHALDAPAAYRGFKKKFDADVKTYATAYGALAGAKSAKQVNAVVAKYDKPTTVAGNGVHKLSRQHDMLACMYG